LAAQKRSEQQAGGWQCAFVARWQPPALILCTVNAGASELGAGTSACIDLPGCSRKPPASPGGFLLSALNEMVIGACSSARQRTKQGSRQAAGAPVAIGAAYLHPNPAGGMVRLTKMSNPFDGIGDGVIEGAVLTVEL
jgi:hypothetical protein